MAELYSSSQRGCLQRAISQEMMKGSYGSSSSGGSISPATSTSIEHPADITSHSPPSPSSTSATAPLPLSRNSHILSLLSTTSPIQSRSLHIRTLHPSHSPSSPSFLPSEILSATPGGFDGMGKEGGGAWREAIAVTLAELGRVRRVRGMGWVEKAAFLDYYDKRGRR